MQRILHKDKIFCTVVMNVMSKSLNTPASYLKVPHSIRLSYLNPYPTAFPYGNGWFYTSTSNKRAARPKLYTKSLTKDLKLMYSHLTLVRISIKL